MAKTRVLLGLIIVGVCLLNFLVYASGLKMGYAVCFYVLTPFFALAALVMLVFSCFRVHVTPEGGLRYDPSNPYWRLMRWQWKDDWTDNILLCKALLLTVISTIIAIAALAMTAVLCMVLCMIVYIVLTHQIKPVDWSKTGSLGIVLGGLFGPLVLANLLMEKWRKTSLTILVLWVVGLFVIGPIFGIMHKDQVDLATAVLQYLKFVIPLVVGISIFFWSMVQLEKKLPALMNTAFGQFLIALKQNYCPMLTEMKTE